MLKRVRGGEVLEATRILVVWGTVLSSTPSLLDKFAPNHDSNTLRLNDRSSRKLPSVGSEAARRTLFEDWSGHPSLLPGTRRDAGLLRRHLSCFPTSSPCPTSLSSTPLQHRAISQDS